MSAGPTDRSAGLEPRLEERLRAGPGEWLPLEEFCPLPRCLAWRLTRQFWELRGSSAFFGGEVPYVAVNDGRLSMDAARLLAEVHRERKPGPVRVLEVGGGSGLFAKLFLDELQRIAPALYEATTYLWTDGSPAMLLQAQSEGRFKDHAGRVKTRLLAVPGMAALGDEAVEGFDLIIANYVLDNLPSTLLRPASGHWEQLEVRATLRADLDRSWLGGRTAREWSELSLATDGGAPGLVELHPWFSMECRFRPVDRAVLPFGALLPEPDESAPKHWTHHEAVSVWLKETLPLLRRGGGLLVNDYGHHPHRDAARGAPLQNYGGSLANGLNYDELDLLPRLEPDWRVASPDPDAKHIQSRWIGRRAEELPAGIFRLIFEGRRRDRVPELLEEARERAERGRVEEARWLYWEASQKAPRCWHVMERWAAFCLTRLRDPQAAHDLSEQGLRMHPRFPGLWNVKGDALYEQKRFEEAGECYRRAIEIHPCEIPGRLNLAYVHQEAGRRTKALVLLAEALALDTFGDHRDAVLEKQRQILLTMATAARDSSAQQLNRFRNLDAPSA